MREIAIKKIGAEHYAALTEIWARAVRATHHFLTGEDFKYFHARIAKEYLPALSLYGAFFTDGEACLGFIGLREKAAEGAEGAATHVEMLFVDPARHRLGLGRALLNFAKSRSGRVFLDVNEQNTGAVDFYLAQGFEIIGRSARDPGGKPYPLLHLFYRSN